MADIQRVMGALCFARRAGTTPYADLSSPTQWDDVAQEFARQCCGLLGQVKALCADAHVLAPAMDCTAVPSAALRHTVHLHVHPFLLIHYCLCSGRSHEIFVSGLCNLSSMLVSVTDDPLLLSESPL